MRTGRRPLLRPVLLETGLTICTLRPGFVEQEPVLFDRTLEENIAYGSAKGAPMKDIQESRKSSLPSDFKDHDMTI